MRHPYDHRPGRRKERDRTRACPGHRPGVRKIFQTEPASRLTLSLPCGTKPPSNAVSGKSAGTGHDAQRDPYPHRKTVRRHGPPPAESPAHFCSIARRRRDYIRLGSLERVHPSVSGTDSVWRGCVLPRGGFTSALGCSVPQHLLPERERNDQQRQPPDGGEPANGAGCPP